MAKSGSQKEARGASRRANAEDFRKAQCVLARATSFSTMKSADKLYYLMGYVDLPTEFAILVEAARLNGISPGDLCTCLSSYPDYFFEIETNLWSTAVYAEEHHYLLLATPVMSERPASHSDASLCASDVMATRRERPCKNGVTCLSLVELENAAEAICQASEYRVHRMDNRALLLRFMRSLNLPVRSRDLEKLAYETLGFTIAKTTMRKYLSEHPDLYVAPTHGVWTTTELAKSLGMTDWRRDKT